VVAEQKQLIERRRKESTLDAFVSVGGSDREGSSIDTNELLRIVKE
jgi:hypothetical protein